MLQHEEKSCRFFSYRSLLIEIVFASNSYRSSLSGIVIASYSYRSKVTTSLLLSITKSGFPPCGLNLTWERGIWGGTGNSVI
jgi:hypothetical protein